MSSTIMKYKGMLRDVIMTEEKSLFDLFRRYKKKETWWKEKGGSSWKRLDA